MAGPVTTTDDEPALIATGTAIGGTVPLRLRAMPNAPAALVISLTADPVPTPFGDLWLNVLATQAVVLTSGPLRLSNPPTVVLQ